MSQSANIPLAIAMFPCDTFGCGYYRMRQPGRVLAERGHAIHVYENYEFNDSILYDIYHFQRITTPKGINALYRALQTGRPVLMDLDDDLFNLFPGHPSAWYFKKGKECRKCGNASLKVEDTVCNACGGTNLEYQDRLEECSKAIRAVDCLTVTTPEMRDRFKYGAKRVEIIPNYIDFNKYDSLVRKGDYNVVVGWAGSFTHNIDMGEMSSALHVIEEFENVYFSVVGVDPEVIQAHFGTVFRDKSRLILLDPLPVEEYPEILASFDIGLAPILDNLFNRCKSELKAEEYGAAHVPIIGSAVAPYSRYVEHGVDGYLCRKPKDWRKYLRAALSDMEKTRQMGENAYAKAKTMDIRTNVHKREELYYELIARKGLRPLILDMQEEQALKTAQNPTEAFKLMGGGK